MKQQDYIALASFLSLVILLMLLLAVIVLDSEIDAIFEQQTLIMQQLQYCRP